ncbi:hypothetical protein Mapa_010434 [Marchantia paleacea]|nr:hypothetical protein Mapa_010434 [Marchantia paleacea]
MPVYSDQMSVQTKWKNQRMFQALASLQLRIPVPVHDIVHTPRVTSDRTSDLPVLSRPQNIHYMHTYGETEFRFRSSQDQYLEWHQSTSVSCFYSTLALLGMNECIST